VQGIYKKKLSETIYFIARRLSHPYCPQSLNLGHEKLLMNFAKLKFAVARSHGHQFPGISIHTAKSRSTVGEHCQEKEDCHTQTNL